MHVVHHFTTKYWAFETPLAHYNQFTNNYFKFITFRNENSFQNSSNDPKIISEMIVKVVLAPHLTAIHNKDIVLPTDASKISKLTKDLKRFYKSSKGKKAAPLRYLDNGNLPRTLVRLIILKGVADPIRLRAQYALQSLEKVDSGLSALNRQVNRFLLDPDVHTRKIAEKCLKKFITNDSKSFVYHCPIQAHDSNKRKALPDYSDLIFPINGMQTNKHHDAFWRLEKIYIGTSNDLSAEVQYRNLKQIAPYEGFQVQTFPGLNWLRDPMLILDNKEVLVPACLHRGILNVFGLTHFVELVQNLLSDSSSVMGAIDSESVAQTSIAGMKECPFYFEGGNFLPAINVEGEKIYLCGASNVLFSILNARHLFSSNEKKMALLEEMKNSQFSKEAITLVQSRLEKGELLSQFSSQEDKEFLAKVTIALTKHIEKLMAETVKGKVIMIGEVFESQPDYHLDMFLMPAPNGLIFIQDFSLTAQVLKRIANHLHLKPEERKRYEEYLMMAEDQIKTRQQSLNRTAEILRKAGFNVIAVPGVFHDKHGAPVVNFLNSVVGVGQNGPFCITNGSSHPFDQHLRDAFAAFMKAYGINRVYYVGRESECVLGGDHPTHTYAAAEGSLGHGGGIHCRTQEINALIKDITIGGSPSQTLNAEQQKPSRYVGEALPLFFMEMLELKQ